MTFTVDRLRPDDWERARSLRLAALREAPDAFYSALEDEQGLDAAAWRSRLSGEHVTFVASDPDGRDIGCATVGPHHDVPDDATLTGVWVRPERRRGGVAEHLCRVAMDHVAAAGYPRVRLVLTDANEAAVALYRRLGFTRTARSYTFPAPREHITAHEMVRELAVGQSGSMP